MEWWRRLRARLGGNERPVDRVAAGGAAHSVQAAESLRALLDDPHIPSSIRSNLASDFARLAVELVDAGRVDQVHAAAGDVAPRALGRVARRAVQHADVEDVLTEERIGERRLADADAPEYRDVQLAALELAEHRFEPREVGRKIRADRRRDVRVVEQRAHALRRLHAVRGAVGRRERRGAAQALAQASPPVHRARYRDVTWS